MMILSQYHIFELDTINIYSAYQVPSVDATPDQPIFSLVTTFKKIKKE